MERVVTINLNGNPYQLEEPAYDALRAYMDRAAAALSDNPDKAEIVRDLEQAVADKCNGYLSASKSVVNAADMTRVLAEMGPVEGEGAQNASGAAPPRDEGARPQRRLFRIYDRTAWTGVSAGMAAYAGVDAAWVRALWIISALFTGGFTLLVYLVLIFVIPVASTGEEIAAAHGAPFNAQEVIDRAKRDYARVSEDISRDWRSSLRVQRRAWREQMRAWRHRWHAWDHGGGPAAAPAQPVGYLTRVLAGMGAFVFSIVTAALLIAFLIAFFSFLSAGAILGWTPPGDIPSWLVLVVIAIAYAAISAPFSALRRASYATVSGYRQGGGGMDGLITLGLVLIAGFFAYWYIPEAREFMRLAGAFAADLVEHLRQTLN